MWLSVHNVPVLQNPRTSTSIGTLRFSKGHSLPLGGADRATSDRGAETGLDIFQTLRKERVRRKCLQSCPARILYRYRD